MGSNEQRTSAGQLETGQAEVDQVQAFSNAVIENVEKVIVGKRAAIETVLVALLCEGHVLIEDAPGTGKTMLARAIAISSGLEFKRLQCTPDLLPSDVTGVSVFNQKTRTFEFRPGPIFCNVLLADEINRATPKTQSALLEAMQEHSVTVGGYKHVLDEPFFVMATQNPIEQEGTYPLPEAQLDRFLFKVIVHYSSRDELKLILDRTTTGYTPDIQKAMTGKEIIGTQKLVRRIVMAPHVQDYAIRLGMASHPGGPFAVEATNKYVRWGASPRAVQTLTLGAKLMAMLDGRFNTSFSDVQQLYLPAMRHRVLLNFEGEAEGVSTDDVLKAILEATPTASEAVA
jgi:MoxR-like ATPase